MCFVAHASYSIQHHPCLCPLTVQPINLPFMITFNCLAERLRKFNINFLLWFMSVWKDLERLISKNASCSLSCVLLYNHTGTAYWTCYKTPFKMLNLDLKKIPLTSMVYYLKNIGKQIVPDPFLIYPRARAGYSVGRRWQV